MSNKDIEKDGIALVRQQILSQFADAKILEVANKGRRKYAASDEPEADLIVTVDGKRYDIEVKASGDVNLRFTHQTIGSFHKKSRLGELMVALVSGSSVRFFRIGALPDGCLGVEPHFILQPRKIPDDRFHSDFGSVVGDDRRLASVDRLLDSPVRKFVRGWRDGD